MKKTFILLAIFFLSFQLGAQKFEGKGANSPEEAVSLYINALKTCDYNQIISCYAVETLVDKYDISQYLIKMKCATPVMKMIYPKDNLLKQTGKFEVLDQISKMIKFQIWNLSDVNFLKTYSTPQVKGNPQEVIDQVFPSNAEKTLASIKFSNEFIRVEKFYMYLLVSDFSSDIAEYDEDIDTFVENQKNYHEQFKKIYGCDDIKDVAASFYLNEKEYFYFAETIKYGNKWYISPNQGYLASILGLEIPKGCMTDAAEFER